MIPRYTISAMNALRTYLSKPVQQLPSSVHRRLYHHSTSISLPISLNRTSTRTLASTTSSSPAFNFFPHIAADASAPTPPPRAEDSIVDSLINTTSKSIQDLEALEAHELRSMAGTTEPALGLNDNTARIIDMFEKEVYKPRSTGVEHLTGGVDGYSAEIGKEHTEGRRGGKCMKHSMPLDGVRPIHFDRPALRE
ncbi:hypothetical protein HK097_010577 [Rhizophlyctis rosea]|uniref:Uncharacterized protein n=1 Tax=Rhizophlyctis rosea TaxID=64517 RepID=A0AAD5X8U0_9FUNG|nr:hypothetical protein HK097_010577 [Rhizophlyctis rosea]